MDRQTAAEWLAGGSLHPQYVHQQRLQEKRLVAENQLFYRLQAGLAGTHPCVNSSSLNTSLQ